MNSIDDPVIFAYLTNQEVSEIQEKEGVVCVMNLSKNTPPQIISAHDSKIKTFRLNYKGTKLATASMKGTKIRIFDTKNGHQ